MKLHDLRIQNFKSIEDAAIENVGDLDVFSGKNNAGKTAIFEAISTALKCPVYPQIANHAIPPNLITGKKPDGRIMRISLVFVLDDKERLNGIQQYLPGGSQPDIDTIANTKFLEKIEYEYSTYPNISTNLCLYQIRISGEHGEFGIIAQRNGNNVLTTNIEQTFLSEKSLTSKNLTDRCRDNGDFHIKRRGNLAFPFILLHNFANKVILFSPFRQSKPSMPTKTTKSLDPTASNLVQRIFTLKNTEEEKYKQLCNFAETVLPQLGTFKSTIVGEDAAVCVFADEKWGIDIDIHEMGSGVEQLLTIACEMISQNNWLIMIENPEHHLHPGAQRSLLHFIRENLKDSQVFISAHSPVFLNQKDLTIHIIKKTNEGTKVKRVQELNDLSSALDDLGSRNSDIMFADFVLFVEGPTDESIFKIWAKKLGVDFDSNNVSCITIHGSRNFNYYANSDILQRFSSRSPVPHLFIIDRDEKSEDTIQKIKNTINQLHILKQREIENYFFSPRLILEALKIKAQGNSSALEKLQNLKPDDIEQLLMSKIEKLKHHVILKRIKEEIGGGTFLPDEALNAIIEETKNIDMRVLTDRLTKVIQIMLNGKCGKERIRQIVNEQTLSVNNIWTNGEEKKKVTPGEEVLTEIFKEFGFNYNKEIDGQRIAQLMKAEEIPSEIKLLIQQIKS
jgi:predicted ATP-dependent endonuclease of OLD family